MIEAYPLCWPLGQRRTARPERSRFGDRTLVKTILAVKNELQRMQARNMIISTNIPVKLNGEPYANYQKRIITDRGAAVYFDWNGKHMVLACDKWDEVECNLWAIAKTIEAMRSLERWGVSDILERTFTGFTALPAPGEAQSTSCWDILGIEQTKDIAFITSTYRARAMVLHPDKGGTAACFDELVKAFDNAKKWATQ